MLIQDYNSLFEKNIMFWINVKKNLTKISGLSLMLNK